MRRALYIIIICGFIAPSLLARGRNEVYDGGQMLDSTSLFEAIDDSTALDTALAWPTLDTAALDSAVLDTTRLDSLSTDSLALDSTATDTIYREPRKPFLDAPIFIKFVDSLVYEPASKDIYMHKQGNVKYQKNEITADYIKLNTASKLVAAHGVMDTTVKKMTRTKFVDGKANYDMDSMAYNMNSGKALIYGVHTTEGEGILFGGKVKKMKDNVIHMHNGRYTTCDAECPHFYLQMTKGTVVPGKQTVFGPAYLVFEDVPLYPLTIPFGFFPQKEERNSGIIIPEIGEERTKGFFLRNGGYYWAINDYVDLKLTAGIYTLGSWEGSISSSYAARYKFRGSFSFGYAKDVMGVAGSKDYVNTSGLNIRWTHQQDPKFNPTSTFSASVNYTSNSNYNKYNANNMQDYLASQITSTVAYSKNWDGLPLALSVNASYTQNTQDSTITMTLPNFVFNVSRIAPFKRKNPVGKERWYEKIAFTYTLDFQNRVDNIKDTNFFKAKMFKDMKTGVQHTIPISASFNLWGALNISPSFNYRERWYFSAFNKNWDAESRRVVSDTSSGFYRVYDYSASISMNTKVYGTWTVGKGKKSAIFRHVLTPRISGSYRPDFGASQYGFWKTIQSATDGSTTTYSPFSNGLYGTSPQGASAAISFGIDNTLEAKIPSKKDSTGVRKIKIIEQLSISSSYNFLAREFKLAPFSFTVRIPIVKNYNFQVSGTLDPYALENGRRINEFAVSRGGFLRLTSLNFSIGYGFKSKEAPQSSDKGRPAINNPTNNRNAQNFAEQQQANFFASQAEQAQASQLERARLAAAEYYDFSIPWSVNLNYTFNYTNPAGKANLMHSMNLNASVNLTAKWGVSISGGYDFSSHQLTPGTIQITRDLHCWQMSFSWVPVGFRQSWSFTIQAKSSMLSDLLKWKKDQSFLDNYYY